MELLDNASDDALDYEIDSHILKEGFLKKKKTRGIKVLRPKWQTRYFALNEDKQELTYTADETGPVKGVILCSEIRLVRRSKDAKNVGFEIKLGANASHGNENRVFYLLAEDPRDADDWVSALNHVISLGKKEIVEEQVPQNENAAPAQPAQVTKVHTKSRLQHNEKSSKHSNLAERIMEKNMAREKQTRRSELEHSYGCCTPCLLFCRCIDV